MFPAFRTDASGHELHGLMGYPTHPAHLMYIGHNTDRDFTSLVLFLHIWPFLVTEVIWLTGPQTIKGPYKNAETHLSACTNRYVPPILYIRATNKSVVVVLSIFNTTCTQFNDMYYMYMYMQLTKLHYTLDKSNKHSNVC